MKKIRIRLGFIILMLGLACSAIAQSPAGTWSGSSICTIKDSPCHDESVIYHITEPDPAGRLMIQADKLVNGKPENMGTLECTFATKSSKITCQIPRGTFEFDVAGDKITGTLREPDGRLYRNISLTRSKS